MDGAGQILVADIGGTNARFALARKGSAGVSIVSKQVMEADDYASIADAARTFLAAAGASPESGVFAVAAPVVGDEIIFTNSPWRFSQMELARRLGLATLTIVNDFVAMARGAVAAPEEDRATIKQGTPAPGAPVAVLGPGTGLGLGIVIETSGLASVLATQGGFSAFAPQDEDEIEVLRFLRREHSFIPFEHVLSGRGLINLYRASSAGAGRSPRSLQPHEITAAALDGSDPSARAATDMFCAILGTFAGDAALTAGARGGVILAGGILPKIETILRASRFAERFAARGSMAGYMAAIPVWLLRTDDAALTGAAFFAD